LADKTRFEFFFAATATTAQSDTHQSEWKLNKKFFLLLHNNKETASREDIMIH
jgi:hypothetical protein